MKIERRLPKTKQLDNTLGGKWRNIPFQGVWVDETNEKRMVRTVCRCSGDDDCMCGGCPCFYGEDGAKWLFWGIDKVKII